MSLRFTVFGGVRAFDGDDEVDVGHARQRHVLAALVVDAGRSVPADALVDRVWGERPPRLARGTLHSYFSRLRSVGVPVVAERGGYFVDIAPESVDANEFRDLIDAAADARDDQAAAVLLRRALELSAEEALPGVDSEWAVLLREEFARLRFTARLDLNDIELRRRRHSQILPQLEELLAVYPLDERLSGQTMLALYRAGRQAKAIAEHGRIRTRLATELGVDPSPQLQAIYQQILTGEADIAAAVAVPRQLPTAAPSFVGRADLLAQLDELRAGGTRVLSGIGGVGKTWLALQWAGRNLEHFPDGQLYVDLHGFGPGEPMSPDAALLGFLQGLGVDSAVIPADRQSRAALYRSTTAGRRLLVVLDNAGDTAQVAPLLPGGGSALVTSRNRLAGLVTSHGARPVLVDVLDDAEARDLFVRQLDSPRLSEPALDDLVEHCAGLPLALGIVAARAVTQPDLPLSELADELRDQASRLDGLDSGEIDLSLRAVFSSSLRSLPPDAVELFTLLGSAPGPDISVAAAAALAGVKIPAVRNLLRQLENASLIARTPHHRYRMHDLVRLHARELSSPNLSTALLRVFDFYRLSVWRADLAMRPTATLTALEPLTSGVEPAEPSTLDEAVAWFDAEHDCLLAAAELAADHDWCQPLVDLLLKSTDFRVRRGRCAEWLDLGRRAIVVADRAGDDLAALKTRRLFASDAILGGTPASAVEVLDEALATAERLGDTVEIAHTQHVLAGAWEYLGDDKKSVEHNLKALALADPDEHPLFFCRVSTALAHCRGRLGAMDEAAADLARSVAVAREHELVSEEANAVGHLAWLDRERGDLAGALTRYEWVVDTATRIGNISLAASYLAFVGECRRDLGDVEQARAAWSRGLDLYRTLPKDGFSAIMTDGLATLPSES
ncbi:AfsR/SARP family transcriptional regulator [Kutzneria chonburiensis]|uniref:BTAD domain-containing putative transcriptional regulator n=1 Tax=Kutzneria chonburiensis TaxID=1483604 RepID=A0ABV6MQ90_9PSEU|nr:BTAD domain-containing putative transcriptional regulator [Kutzneria chonburiensis]